MKNGVYPESEAMEKLKKAGYKPVSEAQATAEKILAMPDNQFEHEWYAEDLKPLARVYLASEKLAEAAAETVSQLCDIHADSFIAEFQERAPTMEAMMQTRRKSKSTASITALSTALAAYRKSREGE